MAGAVFGVVQLSLSSAGAVLGEIWNDTRNAKCRIFQSKCAGRARKVTSVARRVVD